MLPADLDSVRADVEALLEAAGAVDGLLRLVLTRGGRRLAMIEPLPAQPDGVETTARCNWLRNPNLSLSGKRAVNRYTDSASSIARCHTSSCR